MKNLTTRVPNYMQIYFSYSTVTSACQGSGLAYTQTVFFLDTIVHVDAFSSPKQTRQVSELNKYSKSIATKLFYQRTPIDNAIYEKFVCYNHKTKYTD